MNEAILIVFGVVVLFFVFSYELKLQRKIVYEILRAENRWLYGLEIVALSEGTVSRGAVYTALDALEVKDKIERESAPDGRFRYRVKKAVDNIS